MACWRRRSASAAAREAAAFQLPDTHSRRARSSSVARRKAYGTSHCTVHVYDIYTTPPLQQERKSFSWQEKEPSNSRTVKRHGLLDSLELIKDEGPLTKIQREAQATVGDLRWM